MSSISGEKCPDALVAQDHLRTPMRARRVLRIAQRDLEPGASVRAPADLPDVRLAVRISRATGRRTGGPATGSRTRSGPPLPSGPRIPVLHRKRPGVVPGPRVQRAHGALHLALPDAADNAQDEPVAGFVIVERLPAQGALSNGTFE